MNTLLDNLFARRPKIHYVCPPLCGCQFVISSSGQPAVSFEAVSPLECVKYRIENGNLLWDDYPGAACYTVYQAPPPEAPPPVGLPCVTYYLINNTSLSADFTWDPYPDATSYNIYRNLGNQAGYTRTQSNIPVSVLPINCESVIVTANTSIGETLACVPLTYCSPCRVEIAAWLLRVAATGSPEPSIEEQVAVCDFVGAMKAAALWDKMHALNHWSPTSVNASLTWLKQGFMPDAASYDWRNLSDIAVPPTGVTTSINGIFNNGLYVQTTVPCPTVYPSVLDCGLTAYAALPHPAYPNDVVGSVLGAFSNPNQDNLALHPWKPYDADPAFGTTIGRCWAFQHGVYGTPALHQAANRGCGYVSMNRIGINNVDIYYAASNTPHQRIGSTNISHEENVVPTGTIQIFSDAAQHNVFLGTLSFLALHEALTETESAAFAGIVQAFRAALGGGFV